MKHWVFALGAVFFGTFSKPIEAEERLHFFGIGGRAVLCVPSNDLDWRLMPYARESVFLNPTTGTTPGIPFLLKLADSQTGGSRVGRYRGPLAGSVSFLSSFDQKRFGPAMRARDTEDEWFERGKCPSPSVEMMPEIGYFFVKCSRDAAYESIWSIKPDKSRAMPNPNEFVIATCNDEYLQRKQARTRVGSKCSRIMVRHGLLVDYWFMKVDALSLPALDRYLSLQVEKWKRSCTRNK